MSWFDTHPGSGGVATHPVTAKVIHNAGEHRVSTLGDGHVLQRVQKIRLQSQSWKYNMLLVILLHLPD